MMGSFRQLLYDVLNSDWKVFRFSIILIFSFFIQSCSYQLKRIEDTEGNKYWTKYYKDYEKQELHYDKNVFKYEYQEESYPKYNGFIWSDTTHGSTFIQFDTVRVYLFKQTDFYKQIFTSGLVSGQMLYCKMDSTCQPTKGLEIRNAKTGEVIIENLWGWTGHTITIDHFEELQKPKSTDQTRRFKFWVNPYKHRFNGGNIIFILELTNSSATKETDLNSFIENAEVTFLKNVRMMI